jgi:hypothetical protein
MKSIVVPAVLVLSVAASAPALAATTGGHCPPASSGFVLWDADTEPYIMDNRADTWGSGNGNGVVCAKPMQLILDENGEWFQLYNFIDDTGAVPR